MDVDLVTLQFSSVILYSSGSYLIISQRKQEPMKDKWQCPRDFLMTMKHH